jgi:hypothetical protein
MLIIQSHKPEAAGDDFMITSGVNDSSAKTGLIASKFFPGTKSLSTYSLKPSKISKNLPGFPNKAKAVFHGFSVFNLPLLSTGTSG